MSNNNIQNNKTPRVLTLTCGAARDICKEHGHKKAAQKIVDALLSRAHMKPAQVSELVDEQILIFAQSLVKCVERVNEGAGNVLNLPTRAARGHALRNIRKALENLRHAIEGNWEMTKPLLEIETTEQLGKFLTNEAAAELIPASLRSEYRKISRDKDAYQQQQIKLGYLLRSGSGVLTRLIKRAKITLRDAEKTIQPGASPKAPVEMILIRQLAEHFEWALEQKAAWTEGGPFSKFCADVFYELEFETEYSWEHLIREGLKLHRKSFVARWRHEPHETLKNDGGRSNKRKPRKKQLVSLKKRKTTRVQ